jgi:putative nucleotidyltransferase with HDIG domain
MIARFFGTPRLVVRTSVAMFAVVTIVLAAILFLIGIRGSQYVRETVTDKLTAGQRMLSALEQRQSRELQTQVAILAESPTLKAAIDTYQSELAVSDASTRAELILTIERELGKLAERIQPDVLAVSDPAGNVLATAGRYRGDWPRFMTPPTAKIRESMVSLPSGLFRRVSAPLELGDAEIGSLSVATAMGRDYAQRVSALSGAGTLVTSGDTVVATTLPAEASGGITPAIVRSLPGVSTVTLGGAEYAVRQVMQSGTAAVYTLDSIDGALEPALTVALNTMIWVALAAFGIAGLVSVWTARSLARPIDTLSRSLSDMTQSGNFETTLRASGSSLEVDALAHTFNSMMLSVSAAEAETQRAYVGAIRALALALDARDPYTAGHSERVAAISVAVGKDMQLPPEQLDVLRLGALLHDIGKIGISDNVLRKPTALTPEEFELIKEHPGLGARILRTVPFLAQHLPIVELHHERPDGRGYPYGLRGEEIPLLARIVHVADAYDAMTTARAYRAARPLNDVLSELWRNAGSDFDLPSLQALVSLLPRSLASADSPVQVAPVDAPEAAEPLSATVVQFERRVS